MGIIRDEIELIGINQTKKLTALFDSGAYRNYLKKEIAEDLGFHIFEGKHRVILADGGETNGFKVRFKGLKIKELHIKNPEIIVMDYLYEDAIIGSHLMQQIKIILDMRMEKIRFIP